MFASYQVFQFPALPPATSSTARRFGSKANRIREVGGASSRSEFLEVVEFRSLDAIHEGPSEGGSVRYQCLDGLRDLVGEFRLPLAEVEVPVLDLLEQQYFPIGHDSIISD